MAKHIMVLAGLLLAAGAAFGDAKTKTKTKPEAKTKTSAGQMQVEEPAVGASVTPAIIHNEKISKEQRAPARGLSAEQKQAFRERKEKMQQMITLITEKRRALLAAKPEERAALARELHSLILERDPDGLSLTGQARVAASEKSAGSAPLVNAPAVSASVGASATAESQSSNARQEEIFKQQQEKLKEKWQRKFNSKDED